MERVPRRLTRYANRLSRTQNVPRLIDRTQAKLIGYGIDPQTTLNLTTSMSAGFANSLTAVTERYIYFTLSGGNYSLSYTLDIKSSGVSVGAQSRNLRLYFYRGAAHHSLLYQENGPLVCHWINPQTVVVSGFTSTQLLALVTEGYLTYDLTSGFRLVKDASLLAYF